MSRELFSRNADLARLRDEGYFVQIKGGFLIMRDIPYVDSNRQVRKGNLISSLTMAGDETRTPDTHVIYFDGDYPCQADGSPISQIANQTTPFDFGNGVVAQHAFSSKPEGGYVDYHHKMTTYATIISGSAHVLEPESSPRSFRVPEDEEHSVFNYAETASDRVGIGALTARLADERIAIIGVGGTGSYILDLVAKTPVREIRLFDGDEFLQHNAFRAPGAPTLELLREAPSKTEYFKDLYGRMHRGIVSNTDFLTADNLDLLDGVTFAFLSMDAGENKRCIVEKLETIGAGFIDVGMGLELVDGSLGGILRVTTSTPAMREHIHNGRLSFAGGGANDVYASNIQVADLNMLNAALAVVKWKKLNGFYRDGEFEHHSTYTTDSGMLLNGDIAA